jgi:hypothetical protein
VVVFCWSLLSLCINISRMILDVLRLEMVSDIKDIQ